MTRIPHKRRIIDAGAFAAALESALETASGARARRRAILEVAKDTYGRGLAEIRRRHEEEGARGRRTARELAYLSDRLIEGLYGVATRRLYRRANPTDAERLLIAATGGYGRGELAPFSDLDLLFVYPYKPSYWHENVIEFLLYTLWDVGLKVGHAVRSPGESIRLAREDLSIRTALLEMRRITGDDALYRELAERYRAEVVSGTGPAFIEAKLAERDARHVRMGDSRYVVEPNLKEGKGGLRDLQTLFWITGYLYGAHRPRDLHAEGLLARDEMLAFRKAEAFLWTVRVALHFHAGRAEERLTFDHQAALAKRLGYRDRAGLSGVERFMKHYFLIAKEVGALTRVICAALEARHQKRPLFSLRRLAPRRTVRGFRRDGDRLTVARESVFVRDPRKMITIFRVAHETGLDIHPDALRHIGRNLRLIDRKLRADPEANRAFLEILISKDHPEIALRRMNEAGVLGRFVPDFGRIVAQMQYDMYHHYTVDEHTIRAIGLLAAIERGELAEDHPLSTVVIHKLVSRRALYLAVFLHDIAKGRGGDHSDIGARIALRLCPRLGLTQAETELVAWLVRWHLLMSRYAFKRDLSDHKTILDFCEQVKSPERLKLLVILTVADIRAVGPGAWNGWKGQLLRELYEQAEEVLLAGHASSGRQQRVAAMKAALAERLADWPDEEIARQLERFLDSYWIAEDLETIERDARLVRASGEAADSAGIVTTVKRFQAMTEIGVWTRDRRGLFARLAGALAGAGANIVGAKIHTTHDGMALDHFRVQSAAGKAIAGSRELARLEERIRAALRGRMALDEPLPLRPAGYSRRTDVFRVEPMVLIDNRASNRATVIEVNARDRPGLLYDLTRALTHLRLSIFSAHVATYGERAVDVFYVQDLAGEKVTGERRLAHLETILLAATRGEVPAAAQASAAAAPQAHGAGEAMRAGDLRSTS